MFWHEPVGVALTVAVFLCLLVGSILAVGVLLPGRRRTPTVPGRGDAPRQRGASWLSGMARTRGGLARRLLDAWGGAGKAEEWLLEVEQILLSSDVGVKATGELLERLRPDIRKVESSEELRRLIRGALRDLVAGDGVPEFSTQRPTVVLVVGVNGVGKTTTIAKLAHRFRQRGQKVLLVAADTFRAAAVEQLQRWAERVGADLVKHQTGADPSAVAFDGVQAAISRGVDIVVIDTAGRLHVKTNLMEEVKKISRTIGRQLPGAPHQVLLVIDATTGQNALNQARVFHEALGVTGVALTKLDGTAKGGIALAIRSELGLPICYVGLGERPEDLTVFDPDAFVEALFPEEDQATNAA
jgi:fused signal recognition particle receptor